MSAKIFTTVMRRAVWLRRWLAKGRHAAANLLFPPRCACCDAEFAPEVDGLMLCAECRGRLAPDEWHGCPRCGARVSSEEAATSPCSQCRGRRFSFDTVVPLGSYDGDLRSAVLRMKHHVGDPLSMALGQLYCLHRGDRIARLRPDVVVPIPMHWGREMTRGTNSPDILAGQISHHLGVPLERSMLVRTRKTLPQAGLPPHRRFLNVRGAFRLGAGYHLQDARVVLVDDILTTGATCGEAAKVLKRAGASAVSVAVVARTADGRGV
ncbi:MAG: double zinc ribbon domain-containing protein [Planctomycetia bacterium]|nr:double zinc ribbon domain-containing protein [Planctomycetia bacterium]